MEEKEEEKFSFDVLLYNQWICTTEFLDLEVTLLVTHWFTCYKCFIDKIFFTELFFFMLCFVYSHYYCYYGCYHGNILLCHDNCLRVLGDSCDGIEIGQQLPVQMFPYSVYVLLESGYDVVH